LKVKKLWGTEHPPSPLALLPAVNRQSYTPTSQPKAEVKNLYEISHNDITSHLFGDPADKAGTDILP